MAFLAVVTLVAVLAGAIATVTGFGIGSLLTPLLAWRVGIQLAVAAVCVPHAIATALRCWRLRSHIDVRVLWSFGVMSAAGGLAGALLHAVVRSPVLTIVLGVLLIFAGVMGLTGLADRMRFGRRTAWLAGAVSGALGGLVGNQGGIRSAALLGFNLTKQAFVATATAIGLIVDGVRMPVYVFTQGEEVMEQWPLVVAATAGVVFGTLIGERVLHRIPEPLFRRVVAAILLAIGILVFFI